MERELAVMPTMSDLAEDSNPMAVTQFYQPSAEDIDHEAALNDQKLLEATSLSIVIPARNEEKIIADLVQKLIAEIPQGLNVEIIVGNNSKSEDRTEEIVGAIASAHPKVKISVINTPKGVSNARNYGADNATGEYLLFLDADMGVSPGFLRNGILGMIKNRYDIAGFNLKPTTNKPVHHTVIAGLNVVTKAFAYTPKPFCVGGAIMIKRKIHNKVGGFNTNMTFAEDADYVTRVANQGNKLGFLPATAHFGMDRFENIGVVNMVLRYIQNSLVFYTTGHPSEKILEIYAKSRDGQLYE